MPTPAPHIDLSSDTELPELLAEHEALARQLKIAKDRQEAIRKRLAQKLGTACSGSLPGWRVERKTVHQKGYSVGPHTYSYVLPRRVRVDLS